MDKPAPVTMFIQTDTTRFRELVQRLTGQSPGNEGEAPKVTGFKRSMSKLHERRKYMISKLKVAKPGLQIKPGSTILQHSIAGFHSPCESIKFSFIASPLSTPSKAFSNLSIKGEEEEEEEGKWVLPEIDREEEEKAIKERRFYLHSSPRCRPGNSEPELLHLFPLISPKNVS
ncbi:VQ motif-containing protein 31-like [Macadamia integrifolia]|uniref:VQ motif-containing protein 31-like n=1 Tax=Macadamia integrifolia TaxID=60698 RepID=UPI001C4F6A18|nr:VQ motif-containing protein 31-like [Macadamia integrifolia]